MSYTRTEVKILLLIFCLVLIPETSNCAEVNDLWLLISSYEDIGMTVLDLAFFLATHGYDATPERSYVTVEFSDGTMAYLTPNGGEPRLANLWAMPPDLASGPVMIILPDAIQKNVTYSKTENSDFIKDVTRKVIFPVTPLGMCYDGSKKLADTYRSFDYRVRYMYDPSEWDWQGHLWILVEDPEHPDRWLAVDSYYGVLRDDDQYYSAPYSFDDFEYLDSINPKWRLV
ncbi:MAG TPA: hypothetical protein HA349_07795 [Methanotrichaceae archaeon]|nr:hypothetical protein [Methanotrichaceae archaeon]